MGFWHALLTLWQVSAMYAHASHCISQVHHASLTLQQPKCALADGVSE